MNLIKRKLLIEKPNYQNEVKLNGTRRFTKTRRGC